MNTTASNPPTNCAGNEGLPSRNARTALWRLVRTLGVPQPNVLLTRGAASGPARSSQIAKPHHVTASAAIEQSRALG